MADMAHIATDKKLDEMEARLTEIYSRASKEIQATADKYFAQFEKQDAAKRKLVEAGKLSEDEYKAWRKTELMHGKRFKALKEKCADQLLRVNEIANAYVNGKVPEVYALNYNSVGDVVDGINGYTFTLTDANTVKMLSLKDDSLLPYKKLDPAKDIPWNMKKINSEVLQGILQGDSIPNIAKRIMNVQEMNKNAAVRTARTIVTGAENKGRQDGFEKATEDGIILKREWIATSDSRTRDWHAELDGQTRGVDEPFENSMGKIMYPGDPAASPANVYNCRCSLAAKVVGFKKK